MNPRDPSSPKPKLNQPIDAGIRQPLKVNSAAREEEERKKKKSAFGVRQQSPRVFPGMKTVQEQLRENFNHDIALVKQLRLETSSAAVLSDMAANLGDLLAKDRLPVVNAIIEALAEFQVGIIDGAPEITRGGNIEVSPKARVLIELITTLSMLPEDNAAEVKSALMKEIQSLSSEELKSELIGALRSNSGESSGDGKQSSNNEDESNKPE